jgi:hypothetical protein
LSFLLARGNCFVFVFVFLFLFPFSVFERRRGKKSAFLKRAKTKSVFLKRAKENFFVCLCFWQEATVLFLFFFCFFFFHFARQPKKNCFLKRARTTKGNFFVCFVCFVSAFQNKQKSKGNKSLIESKETFLFLFFSSRVNFLLLLLLSNKSLFLKKDKGNFFVCFVFSRS